MDKVFFQTFKDTHTQIIFQGYQGNYYHKLVFDKILVFGDTKQLYGWIGDFKCFVSFDRIEAV